MGSKRHMRNIQKHARLRGEQRVGINLTRDQLDQIAAMIRKEKAKLVDRLSWRVTRWRLKFEGNDLFVVYDENRKCILTILNKEWLPSDGSTATLGDIAATHYTTTQYSTERQNKTKLDIAAERNQPERNTAALLHQPLLDMTRLDAAAEHSKTRHHAAAKRDTHKTRREGEAKSWRI